MIYPATAYAWSAISYLAKQIIKLLTQTTALLNWLADANRGLPNSIITHSAAQPSQEALWDANSSHQETSGRASTASSPERGFAAAKGSFPLKVQTKTVLAMKGWRNGCHSPCWISSLPLHTLPLEDEPSTIQDTSREGEVLVLRLADELINITSGKKKPQPTNIY